jgi:hypothetical protein
LASAPFSIFSHFRISFIHHMLSCRRCDHAEPDPQPIGGEDAGRLVYRGFRSVVHKPASISQDAIELVDEITPPPPPCVNPSTHPPQVHPAFPLATKWQEGPADRVQARICKSTVKRGMLSLLRGHIFSIAGQEAGA